MKSILFIFILSFGSLLSAQEGVDLPEARAQWREFRAMPKEVQRKVHKVYTEFLKLSDRQQEATREWAGEWLKLSPEERATMRHRLQRWSRMSEEKKKALKSKWASMVEAGSAE